MWAELTIISLGEDHHVGSDLALALSLINASGLPYLRTTSGACIEGEWDRVMPLIRRCHDRVREGSSHMITLISIEDEECDHRNLSGNISSVKADESRTHGRAPITADTPPSHP